MSATTAALLRLPDYVLVRRGERGNLHAAVPTVNRKAALTVCGRRLALAGLHAWAKDEAQPVLEATARHCPRCTRIGDQVPA